MKDTPPFFVCFSFDDQEKGDRSELTWSLSVHGNSEEEGGSCLIAYRDTLDVTQILDGTHPSQMYQPRSSNQHDRIRVDTSPLEAKQQQELIDLKLQIAKQKEELDILSSKLSQYAVENEVIKAEKTSLIDKLTLARNAIEEKSISYMTRRFSDQGFGNGGSMQMLLDLNARLMIDNDHLQVSFDGMRKSLQSHIKFSLRSSRVDKETIETLQQENEVMRQQQHLYLSEGKTMKLSESEDTSDNSLGMDDITDENQDIMNTLIESRLSFMDQYNMKVKSPHSTLKHDNTWGFSCDNWANEGLDIEAGGKVAEEAKVEMKNEVVEEGAPHRTRSEGLLVDFGETRRPRSQSENLLVDFGQTRRGKVL